MAETKQPAKDPFVNAELMEGVANFRPLSGQRFQFYVIRALERLETQMKTLLGNGRPGAIERLSGRLRKVELSAGMMADAAQKSGRGCRKKRN